MISAKEAYNKHFCEFSVIPREDLLSMHMARRDVIGEAEELKIVSTEDMEVLVKASCPRVYIETLDERIGAYAHASSIWENSEFDTSEARKEWLGVEGPAFDKKSQLLHDMKHGLRNEPDQLRYLKKITKGGGNLDLVMDFKDAATLGRKNLPALSAVNFDLSRLDDAEATYDKLSDLRSASNMSPADLEELKILAFQAFTYLQEAVAEIRINGQHVFWKDPERLDLYKSDHYQRVGKIRTKNEESETVTETSE